jgi:membrane dipeptidase
MRAKEALIVDQRSRKLHDEAIVIDGLEISKWGENVFRNMRAGGLTAVNCTVSILENFRQTINNIAGWQEAFARHADMIMPVKTVGDIQQAKRSGKTGIIFGFQNTSAIEDDLSLLGIFHELGVRVIQLTYMEGNLVGKGCLERVDSGLTHYGVEMVAEMNRLGILIDLSHVGYRTTMDAIEVSRKPVAFTHANPKSLCDHPRNKTDDAISALVRKGGVIGATIFPAFLPAGNKSTLMDFLDVVDYLVKRVGIDHVAIGTDFTEGQPKEFFDWLLTGRSKKGPSLKLDHPLRNPEGIQSAADFPNLTHALLARGYAAADVKKILGENLLRVFREVWIE